MRPLIPEPTGKAIDPLLAQGNIVEVIANDPHIEFYQKKIQEVLLPIQKQRQEAQKQQNG